MTWNYRMIRTRHDDEFMFNIHEVFYDKDGIPDSWSADPIRPYGDSVGELRVDLELMLAALGQPALEVKRNRLRVAS